MQLVLLFLLVNMYVFKNVFKDREKQKHYVKTGHLPLNEK